MWHAIQWASFIFTANCHTQISKFGSASTILYFVLSTLWNMPKSSFNIFFFCQGHFSWDTSFFLSQPRSSLLKISAHSLSSFTCMASLLNDYMSTPPCQLFLLHVLCFFAALSSWLASLMTCPYKMSHGFTTGRKEAMNYTHSAVCVVKLMIRHAVTYICYFCSDLQTEAGSKFVLYTIMQLNPVVAGIWTMFLGN